MIRSKLGPWVAALAAVGLGVAACQAPDDSPGGGGPTLSEDDPISIAFFGFSAANSFAQATFAGIEEYAEANNGSATFFDPNFEAQVQVSQIQDAITSGRFQVFIVQANDGAAVVPAVQRAVAEGITVVVEFTPVGTRFDTSEPQVDGVISLVDVPVDNGRALAEMGIAACQSRQLDPCQVAYLEGFRALPLDNARTDAVIDTLEADPAVRVGTRVEGGYTRESGRTAMQDVLQANPDVAVVIGSAQAISGAEQVASQSGRDDILFIGNGGSRQAVTAVREGRWFGTYCTPERSAGAKAAELGMTAARGGDVPTTNLHTELAENGGICLQDTLGSFTGEYDD